MLATAVVCCVLCPILLSIANHIQRKEAVNFHLLKNWRSVDDLPLPAPLLKWGSYHPGIYHGLRTSTSPSFLAANVFWCSEHDRQIRYQTERDDSLYFEYKRHNGRNFGIQDIIDDRHKMKLETSFVTHPDLNSVTWIQRLSVTKTSTDSNALTLYLAFGVECDGAMEGDRCIREAAPMDLRMVKRSLDGYSESYIVSGNNRIANKFVMEINVRCNSSEHVVSYNGQTQLTTFDNIFAFQSFVQRFPFDQSIQLDDDLPPDSACLLIAFQADEDFIVDLVYHEDIGREPELSFETSSTLISETFSMWISTFEKQFSENFRFLNTTFSFTDRDVEAAKRILSSSLSGIGFFHGSPRLGDAPDNEDTPESVNPIVKRTTLYSATPSRTAFPRGFLWDEGFHQLLLFRWNPLISAQVLTSWMNALLTSSSSEHAAIGWIPREMILGKEAARRVPEEFITQRVTVANPPTLLMVAGKLARLVAPYCIPLPISESPEGDELGRISQTLRDIYPRLHAWVQGLFATQISRAADGGVTFRWRGRSPRDKKFIPNTLASGLDDYPRSLIASPEESHLDLLCWMIWAARAMAELQSTLFPLLKKGDEGYFDYSTAASNLTTRMHSLHWSVELSGFFDVGVHSETMRQVTEVGVRCASGSDPGSHENFAIPIENVQGSDQRGCPDSHPVFVAMLADAMTGKDLIRTRTVPVDLHVQHVPRVGYVNLFPFLLKLLGPEEKGLPSILDMLEDPEHLWSPYGIRSLSAKDSYYKRNNAPHDAPYWR